MITIKNLRSERPVKPWQVRVDRKSGLGNPYLMPRENMRNKVCDLFDAFFMGEVAKKDKAVTAELNRLLGIYRRYGRLELFCWCAPKRCHAETIAACLLKMIRENENVSGS